MHSKWKRGSFLFLLLLISLFYLLPGKIAIAEDYDTLINELYQEHQYANQCPIPNITPEAGCKAVCPYGFVPKTQPDSNGYYYCQKKGETDVVCQYRNYLCVYNEYAVLDKAIEDFKKEASKDITHKEPLTMFYIRLITLDPDVISKIDEADYLNRYREIKIYAQFMFDAFQEIAGYALVALILYTLLVYGAEIAERIRENTQRGGGLVEQFVALSKGLGAKILLGTFIFTIPVIHTDQNGHKYYYPLALSIYRDLLLKGDALAENLGEKFLDIYFKANMKMILDELVTQTNILQKQILFLKTEAFPYAKLVKTCYEVYDTGGKRFVDIDNYNELASLPTKIDISHQSVPSPFDCQRTEAVLLSYKRKIDYLEYKYKILNNKVLRIAENPDYWEKVYNKIYKDYKEIGWVIIPMVSEILHKDLTQYIVKQMDKNSHWHFSWSKGFYKTYPTKFAEEYEELKQEKKEEQSQITPNMFAKAIVLLSLPPGNMIYASIDRFAEGARKTINSIVDKLPSIVPFGGKIFAMLFGGFIGFVIQSSVALISFLITSAIIALLPKIAIIVATLGRFMSLLVYMAQLTFVMPFKAIPLALDKSAREVYTMVFSKVLIVSLIPATVLIATIFGLALYEGIEWIMLYIPTKLMGISNEMGGLGTRIGNAVILAVLFWIVKVGMAYILGKFIWNAPNYLEEWLGLKIRQTEIEEVLKETEHKYKA